MIPHAIITEYFINDRESFLVRLFKSSAGLSNDFRPSLQASTEQWALHPSRRSWTASGIDFRAIYRYTSHARADAYEAGYFKILWTL